VRIKTLITVVIGRCIHDTPLIFIETAKFTNDSNFFVGETGRGGDVEEHSLEMTEVSRGGGRRWWRQEFGLQIFWKRITKVSCLSLNEFKLATTNNMLGYCVS